MPPSATARARIEAILAETEIAVIKIKQTPDPIVFGWGSWDGRLEFTSILPDGTTTHDHVETQAEKVLAAVLSAYDQLLAVIARESGTARQRRTTAEHYRDQLFRRHQRDGLDRSTFMDAIRTRPAWLEFQKALQRAEQTDIPRYAEQLAAFMKELHWDDAKMAAATIPPLDPHTVQRHRTAALVPSENTITRYEKALSGRDAFDRPTFFIRLPRPPSRARRKRRPKKS